MCYNNRSLLVVVPRKFLFERMENYEFLDGAAISFFTLISYLPFTKVVHPWSLHCKCALILK